MSLVKLPLLASGLVAGYIILTPPLPQVPPEQRSKNVPALEGFASAYARVISLVTKTLLCAPLVLETAVVIADHSSGQISRTVLSALASGANSLARRISISPVFVLGCVLGTTGGIIRYQCYRTLGRFFTYEVSIRDGHRLVTEGPYAYVRHPSYTTFVASFLGITLMHASGGSWLRESGILQTRAGRICCGAYAVCAVYVNFLLTWRCSKEDALLRKEFGAEWEVYARRVPYRMIPYVF